MFPNIRHVISPRILLHYACIACVRCVNALHETRWYPVCINQNIGWRTTNKIISCACISNSVAKLAKFSFVGNFRYSNLVILRLDVTWITSKWNKLGCYAWSSVTCYYINPKWCSNTKCLCTIWKRNKTLDFNFKWASVVVISCCHYNLRK